MNIIGQNGNDGIHYDLEEEKPIEKNSRRSQNESPQNTRSN